MQQVSKLVFAALFLWLAYWKRHDGIPHNVVAYLAAITLMIWLFAVAGAITFGRIESKGYVAPLMGLFGGAVVGVIVGSFLGHRAIAHLWLYWLLVLVAAAVMVFLPPLI